MARSGSSIWRSLRLGLLQVGGAILIVFLVMEIWARVFPPKDKTIWPLVQNPAVGTTFRPNARVVLTNGLDFHVEETSNEAGFLDRPLPPLEKPPGVCRIAVIGDSFVEAAQVPIRQKLQVELQRQLESRRPGTKVETMAFGFSGTGQLNQLGYLTAFVAPRKPDLVVLVFVSNDFANNSALLEAIRVGWHPEHAPRIFAREIAGREIELQPIDPAWLTHRLPTARDERPWLHTRLHRISRFYRWLYAKLSLQYPSLAHMMGREPTEADRTAARIDALRKLAPSTAGLLGGWDPKRSASIDGMFAEPDPLPPAFQQAIRFTGFAFDTYKARTEALGAKLVVLGSHELQGRLERRLVELLDRRQIPYVSLRSFIEKHGGRIADAQWRHDAHWSPQGHKWAAEALNDSILAQGICATAGRN
jgi:lysophospholipase L1-like esterase